MIDQIVAALACGRPTCPCASAVRRGQGLVHCLSHEDPTPSLNVTPGRNVEIVVSCHGGCDQRAVITALRERGLWPSIVNNGVPFADERREVARYTYEDRDGRPLYAVIRYFPKDFRASRQVPEEERVLYHLPEVVAAVAAKQAIYVTEGEKDTDALRSLGVVATCNPFGGGKWLDRYSAELIGANVVICQDRDELNPRTNRREGEHAARIVAQSLSVGARSVRILEFPGQGKDAADWVEAGGSLLALEALVDDLPEWQEGERVIHTSRDLVTEFREDMAKRRAGDPDYIGWRIGYSALDREMVYSPGDFIIVAGTAGIGKTSFLQSLERRATVPTLFFSVEMSRRQLMNRRVAAATGIDSWKIRRGALTDSEYAQVLTELDVMGGDVDRQMVDNPSLTTTTLEGILRVARVRFGVKVAYVDYIQRLADKSGESERIRVSDIAKNLARIARETGTAIVGACQVSRQADRKDGTPPFKSELLETGVLEQAADIILAIGRAEGATDVKLAIRKNRHGLDGFTTNLVFDLAHNNYIEPSEANAQRAEARRDTREAEQEIPF